MININPVLLFVAVCFVGAVFRNIFRIWGNIRISCQIRYTVYENTKLYHDISHSLLVSCLGLLKQDQYHSNTALCEKARKKYFPQLRFVHDDTHALPVAGTQQGNVRKLAQGSRVVTGAWFNAPRGVLVVALFPIRDVCTGIGEHVRATRSM